MANTLRIKRRASGGSSGAPSTLDRSELAYNENDQCLYIGEGTGGSATVVCIGGPGAYLTQSSASSTYLTQSSASSTYLTQSSASSTYLTQSSASSTYLTSATAASTYLTTSTATSTYAPLASPTFTGTPAAPTATAGTNTTQVATTAYVTTAISNLVNGAGSALDTLKELADALGNDASFSTTIATSLGEKLVKSSNLSDLTSASTARTNLGLGSMATQSASSVNITGGTIDGVTIDCGTF